MKFWCKIIIPLIIIVLGIQFWLNGWRVNKYTLSSGGEGAGYYTFSKALVELSETKDLAVKLSVMTSEGSEDNLQRVKNGEADFGLVQLGGDYVENVNTIATVYSDVVHILAREGSGVGSFMDIRGKKISMGMPGSGTRLLAGKLLDHIGIHESEIVEVSCSPRESVEKLRKGDIDVVFLVTAMRAPIIEHALESGDVYHISIAQEHDVTQGICSRFSYIHSGVIHEWAYPKRGKMNSPQPTHDIAVLMVPSQLVCHEGVSKSAVYELVKALHEHKGKIQQKVPAVSQIDENLAKSNGAYPMHPGAEAYFKRKDPGFLVVYAEVIALIMSVAVTVVGMIAAFRKWMARRYKNRIDVYYAQVNVILKDLEKHRVTDFEKVENDLIEMRHRAFDELVDEKLPADESFRIFQDLLEQCMDLLEKERVGSYE